VAPAKKQAGRRVQLRSLDSLIGKQDTISTY
jgi:hypothetical protein